MSSKRQEERVLSSAVLWDIALWWAIVAATLIVAGFLVDDYLGLMVVGLAVLSAVTVRTLTKRLVDIGHISAKTGSTLKLLSSAIAVGLIFFVGWIVT